MTRYQTHIDIETSTDRVWHVLTRDMPQNPEPFGILRFEGQIAKDAKIKLWSEVSPKRAFALRVQTLEAPLRMVWVGGMPLGLFKGTRSFTLTEAEQGCRFAMEEVFTGPLAPLITKSIPDLTPSFETFAQTLKMKAETK